MTSLNTIIEEEKKAEVATILTPLIHQIFHGENRTSEKIHEELDKAIDSLSTAIQRAYEAGEREADAKWEREVEGMRKLLEVATCPDSSCNQEGVCIDGYGEPYQCQWCYERHDLLSKIRSTPTTNHTGDANQ